MRFHTVFACIALLGPLSCPQVWCSRNNPDADFYVDDEGSGDGPEVVGGPAFTHIDHEGSGYGAKDRDRPYDANYDTYDETYDDTEDDDYFDEKGIYRGTFDEEVAEGSGVRESSTIVIDEENEDPRVGGHDTRVIEEVIEEIIVDEEGPAVEAHPATHPPPTLTDTSDMDSPIQIHTTKTDERQVSIFAQPSILAAFIGGAVVGLLCAILLVMFIVYRMRKKDEGSYPLDEPKRMPLTSSYSPNDKEIYA